MGEALERIIYFLETLVCVIVLSKLRLLTDYIVFICLLVSEGLPYLGKMNVFTFRSSVESLAKSFSSPVGLPILPSGS